ncbi:MAG: HAD-IIB family hydrolase [Mycoplasmataceae bacterium]|nr:HAD-IIB family hydrolase [Mycoplasmataceae bacterium]
MSDKFRLKKDEKYIFATDLDGTFLTDFANSLHINSFDAVKKILENGHHFVISTGRSWWWVKTIYEQLGAVDATIHFHGAIIHHPKRTDFEEYKTSIPIKEVIDITNKLDIWSFAKGVQVVGRKHHAYFNKGDDISKLFFNCYEFIIRWDETKMSKKEFIEISKEIFADNYIVRIWRLFNEQGSYSAIVSPKGTNKAIALEKVSKYYGVPKENVIYFGDNINDIEALEWAGHSYAVANAKEKAKEAADEILETDCSAGAVPNKIIDLIEGVKNERN